MGFGSITCLARHMHGPHGRSVLLLAKHVLLGLVWR